MSQKVIAVIPARIGSTRLPRKVLRLIDGHPMIAYIYFRAKRSRLIDDLIIATDSEEVLDVCKQYKMNAILTGEHPSGSDRLYEVMSKTDGDFYLNLQGDEPLIQQEFIEKLIEPLFSSQAQVSTLCTKMKVEDALDPSRVKVVFDIQGAALYFTRSLIPYQREAVPPAQYYKHLGFYGYSREALSKFHAFMPSSLEQIEKLEQLRLLENGIKIHVRVTSMDSIGVDVEADLDRVEAYLRANPEERLVHIL